MRTVAVLLCEAGVPLKWAVIKDFICNTVEGEVADLVVSCLWNLNDVL